MLAYKIFRKLFVDGKHVLYSVNQNPYFDTERFSIIYDEDIINYPKVLRTRLFFFNTVKSAEHFIQCMSSPSSSFSVWKCDVADLQSAPSIITPDNATEYWSKILNGITIKTIKYGKAWFSDNTDLSVKQIDGAMTGTHTKLFERIR